MKDSGNQDSSLKIRGAGGTYLGGGGVPIEVGNARATILRL